MLAILVVLHAANAVFLSRLYHSTVSAEEAAREARVTILAEHAGRSVGAIDMALQEIVDDVAPDPKFGSPSALRIQMRLKEQAEKLPQVRAIVAADAHGLAAHHSLHYPSPPVDVSQRDYFTEQKRWHGVGLFIGALRLAAQSDGLPYFPLSRAVLGPNGEVRGIVVALAEPKYFANFYDRIDPGHGAALLARRDGVVLAGALADGSAPAIGDTLEDVLARLPDVTTLVRPVPGLPLQIMLAEPPAWQSATFLYTLASDVAFMLALTAMALFLTRLLVRQMGAREIAEARLMDAIESAPAAFALYDANDRLVLSNSIYAEYFPGCGGRMTPGAHFEELVEAAAANGDYDAGVGAASEDHIKQRLEAHRSGGVELVQKLSGGRWVLTRERRTGEGGVVSFHTDIGQIKRQEEALRHSEARERAARETAEAADRAKSAFLATMSHELRTPLNAVIGFSEIIERRMFGNDVERYAGYGALIRSSGQHLLNIINDILDIAKLQSGKAELYLDPVTTETVIVEALGLIATQASKKGVDAARGAGAPAPAIMADEVRLRQILINLLSNAVKFTPPGGQVRVHTRIQTGMLAIEVVDTGIGMASKDVTTAFEPFGQVANALTRKEEGTGLGLPLTKNLIELHGGRIEIDTAPGAGTTMRVLLPIDGPTRAPAAPPPAAPKAAASDGRSAA